MQDQGLDVEPCEYDEAKKAIRLTDKALSVMKQMSHHLQLALDNLPQRNQAEQYRSLLQKLDRIPNG